MKMKIGMCLLSLVLLVSFTGCKKEEPETAESGKVSAIVPEVSGFDRLKESEGSSVFSLERNLSKEGSLDLGFGTCQWLHPLDKCEEELAAEPEYGSENVVYYAAGYGDSTVDRMHTFVLDESGGTGSGYDTVYYDRDNDNRLDGENERVSVAVGDPGHSDPVRIELQVEVEGERYPYFVNLSAFTYKDENNPVEKVHMNLRNSSYYAGKVTLDGKEYAFAVGDLDSNGMYNDYEERVFRGDRLFVDLNGNGSFKSDDEGVPFSQYVKIAGKWYEAAMKPCGDEIAFMPYDGTFGTLKGSKEYSTVKLFSGKLNQKVDFHEGVGQVLVDEYKLVQVELVSMDGDGKSWKMRGDFRDEKPEVAVVEDGQVEMPKLLPMEISVTVKENEKGELEIEHNLASAAGGVFRCPRIDGERPEGSFTIVDEKGQVVLESKFDYG